MNKKYNIALTGAAGFLGKHIIDELCQAANNDLPLAKLLLLDKAVIDTSNIISDINIESQVIDITDLDSLNQYLTDIDLVIHSASLVDWGNHPKELLHQINVKGTENVIDACKANNISKLIYTSTMDVLHDGKAIVNGDETLPYPKIFNDTYAETKAIAEQIVIANNNESLQTAVIRPCGIYGPADPYHITEIIKAIDSGTLKVRVGDGSALFQHTYVGNVAHGHVMLAKSMLEDNEQVGGEAYFIIDDPAENFFDFFEPIIAALGYSFPPKSRYIPYRIMYGLACVIEAACYCIKPFKKDLSVPLTRSSVRMLCEDFTVTTDKAHRHFGYSPKYSKKEAFETTVAYFKSH